MSASEGLPVPLERFLAHAKLRGQARVRDETLELAVQLADDFKRFVSEYVSGSKQKLASYVRMWKTDSTPDGYFKAELLVTVFERLGVDIDRDAFRTVTQHLANAILAETGYHDPSRSSETGYHDRRDDDLEDSPIYDVPDDWAAGVANKSGVDVGVQTPAAWRRNDLSQNAKLRLRILRKRRRRERAFVKKWKCKAREALALVAAKQAEQQLKKGKQRYFTQRGGLTVGLRATLSLTAASVMGHCLGQDMHASTVTAWEIRLRSAMLASMRAFHLEHYQKFEVSRMYNGGLRLSAHQLQSDATNYTVWQKGKLNVTMVTSAFVDIPITTATTWEDINAATYSKSLLGPMLLIKHPTALGAISMIEQQTAALGVRLLSESALPALVDDEADALPALVDDAVDAPADEADDAVDAPAALIPLPPPAAPSEAPTLRETVNMHIEVWPITTDAGSDIAAAKSRMEQEIENNNFKWDFDSDCLLHQYHLEYRDSLKHMDTVVMPTLAPKDDDSGQSRLPFYSTMAKIMHLWRELARKLFGLWVVVFGVVSAMAAKQVPPQPITGRWGRAGACMKFLMAKPREQAIYVFCEGVKPTKQGAAKAPLHKSFDDVDGFRADEHLQHSAKMGRWATDASYGIRDPRWWLGLTIQSRVSERLDRLLFTVQKANGKAAETGVGSMAVLVWEKGDAIREGIAQLLPASAWQDVIEEAGKIDPTKSAGPELTPHMMRSLILRHVLHVLGGYDSRITRRLEGYPHKLLWFARHEPAHPCRQRAALAKEILETREGDLHRTARKLRALFFPELSACERSGGTISMLVFAPIRLVAKLWRADTQQVEGVMNMIHNTCNASPHIGHALMDARVGNRKSAASFAPKGLNQTKYGVIRADVERLLDDSTHYLEAGLALMGDISRFTTPPPCPRQLQPALPLPDPSMGPSMVTQSVRSANAQWHSASKRRAWDVLQLTVDGVEEAWYCSKRHRYTGILWKVEPAPEAPNEYRIAEPPQSESSYKAFARWRRDGGGAGDMRVSKFDFTQEVAPGSFAALSHGGFEAIGDMPRKAHDDRKRQKTECVLDDDASSAISLTWTEALEREIMLDDIDDEDEVDAMLFAIDDQNIKDKLDKEHRKASASAMNKGEFRKRFDAAMVKLYPESVADSESCTEPLFVDRDEIELHDAHIGFELDAAITAAEAPVADAGGDGGDEVIIRQQSKHQ